MVDDELGWSGVLECEEEGLGFGLRVWGLRVWGFRVKVVEGFLLLLGFWSMMKPASKVPRLGFGVDVVGVVEFGQSDEKEEKEESSSLLLLLSSLSAE